MNEYRSHLGEKHLNMALQIAIEGEDPKLFDYMTAYAEFRKNHNRF